MNTMNTKKGIIESRKIKRERREEDIDGIFVFNEELRSLIRDAQTSYPPMTEMTNSDFLSESLDQQNSVRSYLFERLNEITFLINKKLLLTIKYRFQFYFALIVLYNANMDTCNSCSEALKQVNSIIDRNYRIDDFDDNIDHISQCACTHDCIVMNLYWAQNQYTKNWMIFGCDCIQNVKVFMGPDVPEQLKLINKEKKHHCRVCGKKHVNLYNLCDEHHIKGFCFDCNTPTKIVFDYCMPCFKKAKKQNRDIRSYCSK